MKIYNYTNTPVLYRGEPIPNHIVPIEWNKVGYGYWEHNGQQLYYTGEYDKLYIHPHWNGNFQYDYQATDLPPVWIWVSIFLTFFSFFFVLRIVQKIKSS